MNKKEPILSECRFKLYFPSLYKELLEWDFPSDFTWSQKLYHFGRKDKDLKLGLCKICGERCEFIDSKYDYEEYCCGEFCSSNIHNKLELFNTIITHKHKILHYFNEYVKKHPKFEKLVQSMNDSSINPLSSSKDLFIFLNEDVEHTCRICGKETEFYGWSGKIFVDKVVYFNRTCCKEHCNKYRSLIQMGENNTSHRMTNDTKLNLCKKQSESIKSLIKSGEFTPNVTNSWCHSKISITFKDKDNLLQTINVRSSFEALFIFQNLDKKLSYEKLRIPYKDDIGNNHTYIPDFFDEENGVVFEIKPKSEIHNRNNNIKMLALQEYCKNNNYRCYYITETDLSNGMNKFNIKSTQYMDKEQKDKFLKLLSRYDFFKYENKDN